MEQLENLVKVTKKEYLKSFEDVWLGSFEPVFEDNITFIYRNAFRDIPRELVAAEVTSNKKVTYYLGR